MTSGRRIRAELPPDVIEVICTDRGRHSLAVITALVVRGDHRGGRAVYEVATPRSPWAPAEAPLEPPRRLPTRPRSVADRYSAPDDSDQQQKRARWKFPCPNDRCDRAPELREERLIRVLDAVVLVAGASAAPIASPRVRWDISHDEFLRYSASE